MKRFALRALLLCAAGPLCAALAAMERADSVALGASVYRIEVPAARGYGLGSGVAVAPDTVVTNCHVIGDAESIFVVRGGVRWAATARSRDRDHDLCLLGVPGLEAPAVRLGQSEQLRPGQPVTAIGFTGGVGIQVSDGEVVQLHRHDGARVIQSSNWFSSGASGGALFDEERRLVGILTFRLRGGEAHYFSTPAEWVARLVTQPPRVEPEALGAAPPGLHFWQDGAPSQPLFLRAAVLQQNARWPELETLANGWARRQPAQSEPWALLGTALEQQGRLQEAHTALTCSARLAPGDAAMQTRLVALALALTPIRDDAPSASPCPAERP